MHGQNPGVFPDAPDRPIFTKFCVWVDTPYVFLSFGFHQDRSKMWELWRVEISLLQLKRHIAYTQLVATAQAWHTLTSSRSKNVHRI